MIKILGPLAISLATLLTPLSAAEFTDKQTMQAGQIRAQALKSDLAYDILTSLTTEVGPRLAGSKNDALAVKWAQEKFKALGFDKIWLEPATFPAWHRFSESGSIISPSIQPLHLTALGHSVSTPEQGITAEVIQFNSMDELINAPKDIAKGKIVFINYKMFRHTEGQGYGLATKARFSGAIEAAKKGALAFMMRSVSTGKHRFAHTGASSYQDGVKKIPNVAIAGQDADQIARLTAMGENVKVNIKVHAEDRGEGKSFNVIGQFNGTKNPEQYVLIGGHLDSWDLGTGALDDGAGVAITMAAAKIISQVERPQRSIRVVLFAAEELGLFGAKDYVAKHKDELTNIVAAAESDSGAGMIFSFESNVSDNALPVVKAIAKQLAPLNINLNPKNQAGGGPDLIPMRKKGVPLFNLKQDASSYFDYHHTPDDTLDKVDPAKLKQNVAAYAVFAFMAASSETRITDTNKD